MKVVHLTTASIPGVSFRREMKASTNKRRRETTYICKTIDKITRKYRPPMVFGFFKKMRPTKERNKGSKKAIPVRTAEETRQSIASSLDGKLKNHPTQCIPPNTTPAKGIQKYAISFPKCSVE